MYIYQRQTISNLRYVSIRDLSWRLQQESDEEEERRASDTNTHSSGKMEFLKGWLAIATGTRVCIRSTVGVSTPYHSCTDLAPTTTTTSRTDGCYHFDLYMSGDVTRVSWNPVNGMLAACDRRTLMVWRKHAEKFTLIYGTHVTEILYFAWSHDGKAALMCHKDSTNSCVRICEASRDSFWSNVLINLTNTLAHREPSGADTFLTCGTFSQDDNYIYLGTHAGHLIGLDRRQNQEPGALHAHIRHLAVNTIKSIMVEGEYRLAESNTVLEEETTTTTTDQVQLTHSESSRRSSRSQVLGVLCQDGRLYLMHDYNDLAPIMIDTGISEVEARWSATGKLLVVAGHHTLKHEDETTGTTSLSIEKTVIKVYDPVGQLLCTAQLPHGQTLVSGVEWGHMDDVLFISCGYCLYVMHVVVMADTSSVMPLKLMCKIVINGSMDCRELMHKLHIPQHLKRSVMNLNACVVFLRQRDRCGTHP